MTNCEVDETLICPDCESKLKLVRNGMKDILSSCIKHKEYKKHKTVRVYKLQYCPECSIWRRELKIDGLQHQTIGKEEL